MNPKQLYILLKNEFGDLGWWPMDENYHKKNNTDPRFEIIAGAILTQNTAWDNVEKALINLKIKEVLNIDDISKIEIKKLQEMIKPSGFFKQKADRLKNMAIYLKKNYQGNLNDFFNRNTDLIREELLLLKGIGPETADSILLYAGNKQIFVVDAYTKRLCERLSLPTKSSYEEIQNYFQKELTKNYENNEITQAYNELHALIVALAKKYCRKKPLCNNCPLIKKCKFIKSLDSF